MAASSLAYCSVSMNISTYFTYSPLQGLLPLWQGSVQIDAVAVGVQHRRVAHPPERVPRLAHPPVSRLREPSVRGVHLRGRLDLEGEESPRAARGLVQAGIGDLTEL